MRGRPKWIAVGAGMLVVAGAIAVIAATGSSSGRRPSRVARRAPPATTLTAAPHTTPAAPPPRPRVPPPPKRVVAVREVTLRFTDPARTVTIAGHVAPRSFDTVIRYPMGLPGRFPLIVFGHGFNVSPAPYSALLDTWTRAGYVVAAPIFPLENHDAPDGPNENDLVNQPGDMSLVISSLMTPASPDARRIGGMIDFGRIAVAGQSDGGDTALAAAYDPSVRDTRIKAAVILAGAQDPFVRPFAMPRDGPPLLAIQGTADTINPPDMTYAFYNQAAPPKYLLKLLGAGHQPPYTEPGPDLTIVGHMTLAFLNRYLKGRSPGLVRYTAAGSAGPGSVLTFAR